jgi:hypothetical protein
MHDKRRSRYGQRARSLDARLPAEPPRPPHLRPENPPPWLGPIEPVKRAARSRSPRARRRRRASWPSTSAGTRAPAATATRSATGRRRSDTSDPPRRPTPSRSSHAPASPAGHKGQSQCFALRACTATGPERRMRRRRQPAVPASPFPIGLPCGGGQGGVDKPQPPGRGAPSCRSSSSERSSDEVLCQRVRQRVHL